MRFNTLDEWLSWQETLHPKAIDLGLERVAAVARRMDLLDPSYPVITVAGTNGKGSSVALLAAILRANGLCVGAYTSPHLWRYNERVCVDGQPVTDGALVQAFASVDAARGDISLSYFEFGTLAALAIFRQAELDVGVLEVGLGGRLDAVNIIDADCALVTGIGIDHTEWLGADRDQIGREKAGIFRTGRPAVCSDPLPPASVRAQAETCAAHWYGLGEQYGFERHAECWDWWGPATRLNGLPNPALVGAYQFQNAAGVLMALHSLGDRCPVTLAAIHAGLREVRVAGRFHVLPGAPELIFDVAHNPHAAAALAANLAERPSAGRTLAVCGLLTDKDAEGIAAALREQVHFWYLGDLSGPRGQTAVTLAARMRLPDASVVCAEHPAAALQAARAAARPEDRILVFGSFHTIAELLPAGL